VQSKFRPFFEQTKSNGNLPLFCQYETSWIINLEYYEKYSTQFGTEQLSTGYAIRLTVWLNLKKESFRYAIKCR
jgi:hypothetical protein